MPRLGYMTRSARRRIAPPRSTTRLLVAAALVVVSATLAPAAGGAAAPPVTLSFVSAPQTLVAGATSQTMSVTLTGAQGPARVSLTSDSPAGSFRDAADVATITFVDIAAGQTSASFRYRDTKAGTPTVTAGAKASAGQWNGNKSASQLETVKAGPLASLALAPPTATITAGGSQAYSAQGADQYGNSLGNLTLQTAFSIAPDGSCTGAVCTASKTGVHTVTGTSGGVMGQARLDVQPSPLDHIVVSPQSAQITVGGSQTYQVEAFDAAGNDLGDVTAQSTLTIAPDGSCTGATCTAPVVGPHTVTAQDGSAQAQASLDVQRAPLDHIAISPQSSTISAGESQAYGVEGFDAAGNDLGDVTADSTFAIAPDGSCTAATCSAMQPGAHTVTATDGGKTATAQLQVTAACQTSGPAGGAYTVTVCLTPSSGPVSGVVTVTADITVQGTNPRTAKVLFSLDGQYLLTDFQSPYTFSLPTDRFVDGTHVLEAEAWERDGFVAQHASVALAFQNGVTQPPVNTNGFQPVSGTAPSSGSFVVAAVGDGAGGEASAAQVTSLIAGWNPSLFLYLGDVYEKGTPTEFFNWYGDPQSPYFGRLRAITDPTVGNHEYTANKAPGYFDYWNNAPNWYSVDTPAGWHIVSLNSNSAVSSSTTSAQYQWLAQDLAQNTKPCTLVFYHHPLWNIGAEPAATRMSAIWSLLAQKGVDVVLNGHDHDYQRWVPLDGSGTADPAGVTEFVVGTGGHSLQSFLSSDNRVAAQASGQFGALRLELNAGGASYRYVTAAGSTLDSGAVSCSASTQDTQPPTAPANLTATAVSSSRVDLDWAAATDDVGVKNYDIYRNGAVIATVGTQTSYSDQTTQPSTAYTYSVVAFDAAGNASPASDPASVTTPPKGSLFADGFESGDFSKWTSQSGLVIESTDVSTGAFAAEGVSTGAATVAYKTLETGQPELYYRIRFKVKSIGAGTASVYLGRFRTAANAALLGFYVSSAGKLGYRNDVTGISTTSTAPVAFGVWHTVVVHVIVNDAQSQTETSLDGAPVAALSKTESLGTAPIGRLQLGDSSTGRSYDVLLDDVAADPATLS
jgi:hypothetical protein